jgi:integrase/recombinase XerC
MEKMLQIASGKNKGALIKIEKGFPDTLDLWAEGYFRFEVTTSLSSQKVQKRDLALFLEFMQNEEGNLKRERWSPRLTKAFVDWLRKFTRPDGQRRWNDKTINRIVAHLKTFAKWINKLAPFPLGNPTAKIKSLPVGSGLDIERALTKSERRRLLDTCDQLPALGGRSKDRRRFKNQDRPKRKGYRPWRNRAIVYTLVETGMRRGALANLKLADVDIKKRRLSVVEKGGYTHGYKISKQGLEAIKNYLEEERDRDNKKWRSVALFLPADNVVSAAGQLSARTISAVWYEVCALADIKGRTPHSARHAMGKHIIEKTGNVAAVQRQLGHKNAVYSMQYARISDKELENVLDER